MTFVLINKIVVAALIIAALTFLFIRKKRVDVVFTLSVMVLLLWLVSVVSDGYLRINFVNLSFSEIEFISGIDGFSVAVMYIVLTLLSFAVMRRALMKAGRKREREERQRKKIEGKEIE